MGQLRQPLSVKTIAPTVETMVGQLGSLNESVVTDLLRKGFTGRGRAGARLRVARAKVGQELFTLTQDMEALAAKTRSVDHAMWTLKLFRRNGRYGQDGVVTDLKLRWTVRGIREGYRNWELLLADISRLPKGMRVWYEEANMLAVTMNGLWRMAYEQDDLIRRLMLLDDKASWSEDSILSGGGIGGGDSGGTVGSAVGVSVGGTAGSGGNVIDPDDGHDEEHDEHAFGEF
jgi:hypothetical protein